MNSLDTLTPSERRYWFKRMPSAFISIKSNDIQPEPETPPPPRRPRQSFNEPRHCLCKLLRMRANEKADNQKRIFIHDIINSLPRWTNVPVNDILSIRRPKSIVRARQIGMYLARKHTSRSLPEIGRRFGGKDHSTVLHAVRKIEANLEEYAEVIDQVEKSLGVSP